MQSSEAPQAFARAICLRGLPVGKGFEPDGATAIHEAGGLATTTCYSVLLSILFLLTVFVIAIFVIFVFCFWFSGSTGGTGLWEVLFFLVVRHGVGIIKCRV